MEERLTNSQISNILMEFERSMRKANAEGTIFAFMNDHKIPYDNFDECPYDKCKVRLLIAGGSEVSKKDIVKLLKQLGIDINRVDMILDYNELKTFRWNSLQYSFKYSDIVVGPMGHMSVGNSGFSSVISRMETEDGWPNIIRSEANTRLKFSIKSLEDSIKSSEFYKKQLWTYQ